jgi:hypothetical protein
VRVRKLILSGTPEDDRGRLEEFCQLLAGTEHAAGVRLRALAVELARLGGFEVAAVAYEDESLEFEVVLAGDPLREPVSIGRDKTGGHCQVSWERWAPIGDDAELEKTAQMIAAVTASCVAAR